MRRPLDRATPMSHTDCHERENNGDAKIKAFDVEEETRRSMPLLIMYLKLPCYVKGGWNIPPP